jgi:hypothetical protein
MFRRNYFPLILCLSFLAHINGRSGEIDSNFIAQENKFTGHITVLTDSIDFDTTFVGTSRYDDFTITNIGSDSLSVYDIFTNTIYFNAQNFQPFVLAPQVSKNSS